MSTQQPSPERESKRENTLSPQKRGWANWGDHPFVVIIGTTVAIIGLISFLTGNQSIIDFFQQENAGEINNQALQQAAEHKRRGDVYRDTGDTEQAIEEYSNAILLAPKESVLYYSRAEVYTASENFGAALLDYSQAIEISPNIATYYSARGFVHRELGRYRDAIVDFNKAIELKPENAVDYYNRSLVYLKLGNTEQAIADISSAIQLDSSDRLYFLKRGELYLSIEENDKAISDFRQCSELSVSTDERRECDEKEFILLKDRLGN